MAFYKTTDEFIKELTKQGKKDFLSGDYLSQELQSAMPDSAVGLAQELYKVTQRENQNVANLLHQLESQLAAQTHNKYTLNIIDNGNDEYTIAYVPTERVNGTVTDADIKKLSEEILGDIHIPKFKFSAPQQGGLAKHNSLAEINQRVLDMTKDGEMYIYSKIEKLLWEQLRKFNNPNNNFVRSLNSSNPNAGRTAANSVKYTSNLVTKRMPAIGDYRVKSDESWKARQGTGSKQSLMLRKNYIDVEPIIDQIVHYNRQLLGGYKGQTKRPNISNDRAFNSIKQDIMKIFSQYGGRRDIETIQKELNQNKDFQYIFKNSEVTKLIKKFGEQIHNLHPYIGTSQEGSISNYLMSLVSNADLGIMGGLDDTSSRKRAQVANTLSLQGIKRSAKEARKEFTKKGVVFTKMQHEQGGISSDDLEQRLFGIIYATNEEIQSAQERAIQKLIEKKGIQKLEQIKREVGTGLGAHSGGVLYADTIERAFDATQLRNKNITEERLTQRMQAIQDSLTRVDQLRKKQVTTPLSKSEKRDLDHFEKIYKDLLLEDTTKNNKGVKSRAMRELLAQEIGLGKQAFENIQLTSDVSERVIDGKKTYDVLFREMRQMTSGEKILTDAEYDRLTAQKVSSVVLQEIVKDRFFKTSANADQEAQDYINRYKIGLVKQTDKVSGRNMSGYLQDYVNTLLDAIRSNEDNYIDGKIDQSKINELLNDPNSVFNGWLKFDASKGEFIVVNDIVSKIKGPDELKNFIKKLNNIAQSSWVGKHNQDLQDVFTYDTENNLLINFKKFVGLTGAQQYNGYKYGKPGDKVVRADYRFKESVGRGLTAASFGTGERMHQLYDTLTQAMQGDTEDKTMAKRQKALHEQRQRDLEYTRRSRQADWSIGSDIPVAYGPMGENYEAYTLTDTGELQAISKGKKGYIDLSRQYNDVTEYDSHGNITATSYNGSIIQLFDKVRQANGNKNKGLVYLPQMGVGQYGFNTTDGTNAIMGQGVKLTLPLMEMLAERYNTEDDAYQISQLDTVFNPLIKAERAYQEASSQYKQTLNPEDKQLLDEAITERNAVIGEYFGGVHDIIDNKNGSIYQWQFNKLRHTMMGAAGSSALMSYAENNAIRANKNLSDTERQILDTSTLLNQTDLRLLVGKQGEENDKEHRNALLGMLNYLYGDQTSAILKEEFAKGKRHKSNKNLEDFIVNSVTFGTEAFNKRLASSNGQKLRGLSGLFARFPLSNGLDAKFSEAFAGTNDLIDQGKMRVGLGLGKSVNADFDGDHLVFYLSSADTAFGRDKKNQGILNKQQQQAVDFQNDINTAIGAVATLDLLSDEKISPEGLKTLKASDLAAMFNQSAEAAGDIASRLQKAYTGQLSNKYQTITQAMDELNPTSVAPNNPVEKKNFVSQMMVRGLFEAFTQEAISSKKVRDRLNKKYANGNTDEYAFLYSQDYLKDIDSLMNRSRSFNTYASDNGIDLLFSDMKRMGITDGDKDSVFSNRIAAQVLAYAQRIYAGDSRNFTDINSQNFLDYADALGIKDEKGRERLFANQFKYLSDGSIDFSAFQKDADGNIILPNISHEQLKQSIKHFNQINKTGTIADILNRQREFLPGGTAAINSPAYYLGQAIIQPGSEEYAKLADHLKEPTSGYQQLTDSANAAKTAIDAEAQAEQNKIGIATAEGKAIGALTEEYSSLSKQVQTAQQVQKDFFANEKRWGHTNNGMAVTSFEEYIAPYTGKKIDTNGFEQELTKYIQGHGDVFSDATKLRLDLDTNKPKNVAEALGYNTESFGEFSRATLPLIQGKIVDAIEQTLGAAAKLGLTDINSIADIENYLTKNPKTTEAKKLLSLMNSDGGYNNLINSSGNDYYRVLRLLYGDDFAKQWNKIQAVGSGMYNTTLSLAGADASKIGEAEGYIFSILNSKQAVHGRFDRETYGTETPKMFNPLTGLDDNRDGKVQRDVVNIADKKWSKDVYDGYLFQVMQYVRAEEAIRDAVIGDKTGFNASAWHDDQDSYRQKIYNEFLRSNLGQHYSSDETAKNYLSFDRFSHLIGQDGKGAVINGLFNFVDKKGNKSVRSFGVNVVDPSTGLTHKAWSKNAKINQRIEDYIANGIGIAAWDDEAKDAYRSSIVKLSDVPFNTSVFTEDEPITSTKTKKKHRKGPSRKEQLGNALKKTYSDLAQAYANQTRAQVKLNHAQLNGSSPEEIAALQENVDVFGLNYNEKLAAYKDTYSKAFKRNAKGRSIYNYGNTLDPYTIQFDENGNIVTRIQRDADGNPIGTVSQGNTPFIAGYNDLQRSSSELQAMEEYKELQQERSFVSNTRSIYDNNNRLKSELAQIQSQITTTFDESTLKLLKERAEDIQQDIKVSDKQIQAYESMHKAGGSRAWLLDGRAEELLNGAKESSESKSALAQAQAQQKWKLQVASSYLGEQRTVNGLVNALNDTDFKIWKNQQEQESNQDRTKAQYYQIIDKELQEQRKAQQLALDEWKQKHGFSESNPNGNTLATGVNADGSVNTTNAGTMLQDALKTASSKFEMQKAGYQKSQSGFMGLNGYVMKWFDRMLAGGLIMTSIRMIRKGIRDIVKEATQLDKVMTNLRIVTQMSSAEAKETMSSYAKAAKQLGTSLTEYTQAATEWSRQGYQTAEVMDLVKSSTYLSKLGMIDATTAVKSLTSAMKGFKLEASDSMDVVDKLTALDVKAATTAGDIAEGLSQFANLASLNGVDLDQASAYVATIADVTQASGSSVGQALKTILSRYGNVKASAYSSLNLNAESNDTSGSLNDVERILKKLNISIRDSNLEFKDFDEILDEIADKWNTLDGVSKKAIANAFAGVRQQENFVTLLENYDSYKNLLDVSQNSQGTAEEKYQSYRESYEAAQGELKASFQEVVNNANINNILISLTKVGTKLVGAFEWFIKWGPTLLAQITGIRTVLGKSVFQTAGAKLGKIGMGIGRDLKDTGVTIGKTSIGVFNKIFRHGNKHKTAEPVVNKDTIDKINQVGESAERASEAVEEHTNVVATDSKTTQQNTTATAQDTNATRQDTTATEQNKLATDEQTEAERRNTTADNENTNATNNNTTAKNSSSTGGSGGGGAKFGSGAKAGVLAAVSMASAGAMNAISKYSTAATTHTYNGNVVESSQEAQKKAAGVAAIGGMMSAIPIVGGLIDFGFTRLSEKIASDFDKERDQANDATSTATKTMEQLSSISSEMSSVQEAINGTDSERADAINELKQSIYSKDNTEGRETLERFLGGSSKLSEKLNIIASASSTTAEKISAYHDLQVAEIQAQKSQVIDKYASQLYESDQNLEDAFTNYNDYSGVDGSSIGAGIGVGVAGATAGALVGLTAASLVNVWNPVGWAGLIVAGVAGAVIGGAALIKGAIDVSDAVEEENRQKYYDASKFNILSSSEKIEFATNAVEKALEDGNTEMLAKANALLQAAEQQNALNIQILNELDTLTSNEAFLKATIGTNGDNQYLGELTIDQLKNYGVTAVVEAYAKALDHSGLSLYKLYDGDTLTEAGYNYAESKLREQGDEEVNALLSGSPYTLQELLRLNTKFGGSDKSVTNLLQTFASALNMSVEELQNSNRYRSLTISDLMQSTTEISESISGLSGVFTTIASSAGETSSWMETIVSKFPELSIYMGNTTELFSHLTQKMKDLGAVYIQSQYQELATNSQTYSSLKDTFYSKLSSDQQALLDSGNITNIDSLLTYLAGQDEESAKAILKSLYDTMDEYGMQLIDQHLKDLYDSYTDFATKLLDDEIEELNQQKTALQEINSQREYENKLIEAKIKLENANKDKKRVYRAGVGWVYEADQSAILSAQKELDSLNTDKLVSQLDEQTAVLEAQRDELSSISDKINFETAMKQFNAEFGADGFTHSALVQAITDGIQGTKVSMKSQTQKDSEEKNSTKSQKLQEVAEAWKSLNTASQAFTNNRSGDTAGQYNSALSDYQLKVGYATSAGASNDEIAKAISSTNISTITHLGTEKTADELRSVDSRLTTSGKFILPTNDNNYYYEGYTNMTPDYLSSTYDIFNELEKGTLRIYYGSGNNISVINPAETNDARLQGKGTTDLTSYINMLKDSGLLGSDFILVGTKGSANAVFVSNGVPYQIISADNKQGYLTKQKVKGNRPENAFNLETAASGSLGLIGGNTLINELGTEAIITPNGTITSLPSSTGIVPADITKNLWELGEVAPSLLRVMTANIMPDTIGSSTMSSTTDESFNIGNLEMNVNADASFDVDRFVDTIRARVALTRNSGR